MEEPHLKEQVVENDADDGKKDPNKILKFVFENKKVEKPTDVDNASLNDRPNTSGSILISENASDFAPAEIQAVESKKEDAGRFKNNEISEEPPNQSVEQVNFEKLNTQLEETAQSVLDNDNLEFTEQSINISQLNVELEHRDDSNDAFNALKESETDALQEPKEENEEEKDEDQIVSPLTEETISALRATKEAAQEFSQDTLSENEKVSKVAIEKGHEKGADTDFEYNEKLGSPENQDKPYQEETTGNFEGILIINLNIFDLSKIYRCSCKFFR